MNTDEIYHILRKRLFQDLPEEKEIWEVARAYAQAVRDARQMDITSASPRNLPSTSRSRIHFTSPFATSTRAFARIPASSKRVASSA